MILFVAILSIWVMSGFLAWALGVRVARSIRVSDLLVLPFMVASGPVGLLVALIMLINVKDRVLKRW